MQHGSIIIILLNNTTLMIIMEKYEFNIFVLE